MSIDSPFDICVSSTNVNFSQPHTIRECAVETARVKKAYMRIRVVYLAAVLSLAAGCSDGNNNNSSQQANTVADTDEAAAPIHASAQALLDSMDTTADPCQDFQRFVCGSWIDQATIPADRGSVSRSFSSIVESNGPLIDEILQSASIESENAVEQRIATYYGACMDVETVDSRGAEPLLPMLQEIDAISDLEDLMSVVGRLHARFITPLFDAIPLPDLTGLNIAYFRQAGMGLPERDAYFREDAASIEVREQYQAYAASLLGLLGYSPAEAADAAEQILAFETSLAAGARSPAELRNIVRLYNKVDLPGLIETAPSLPWASYLEAIGQPDLFELSLAVPEFYVALEELVPGTEMEILQHYLRFTLARSTAILLSDAFREADFDFYSRQLSGIEENRPRAEFCRAAASNGMADDTGQLFVDAHFAGASRDSALAMIDDIQAGFREGLKELPWLDAETEAWVREKSMAMLNNVGFPDQWKDYSHIDLDREDFFGSFMSLRDDRYQVAWGELGQRTDRYRWGTSVTTVNAFYSRVANAITFPAAILQSPFFDAAAPAAMNYGAIGAVIGHEITHGFDDGGRFYSSEGTPGQWWSSEAVDAFTEATQCVDELYNGYEALPGVNVNAALTRGENIGDMGGVRAAYAGFQALKERESELGKVDDLTDEQLFFVSYGQVWCQVINEDAALNRALNDPHAPDRFRIIGPLSQMPAFSEAFSCAAGTPMNPPETCRVW
jgi:putative endopeptidase